MLLKAGAGSSWGLQAQAQHQKAFVGLVAPGRWLAGVLQGQQLLTSVTHLRPSRGPGQVAAWAPSTRRCGRSLAREPGTPPTRRRTKNGSQAPRARHRMKGQHLKEELHGPSDITRLPEEAPETGDPKTQPQKRRGGSQPDHTFHLSRGGGGSG